MKRMMTVASKRDALNPFAPYALFHKGRTRLCLARAGVLVWLLLFVGGWARAQGDCGVVERVVPPVDMTQFRLVQDYAARSTRHQGRYHTGEDYAAGRGVTVGQAVFAIARGRVLVASPNGWGIDGGVLLLEHRLPDGATVYSMYGHVQAGGVGFPERLTCVEAGQIIAVIADVRPAPHLHLEIRTQYNTSAGAGYTHDHPDTQGYTRPTQFLRNYAVWTQPAHRWHFTLAAGSVDALLLNDDSLLLLDKQGLLRRVLPDGRVLWRQAVRAVALMAWRGRSFTVGADGTMTALDIASGTLGESWRVADFAPVGAPIELGGRVLFPAQGGVVMLDDARRAVLWRAERPEWARVVALPSGTIGLLGNGQVRLLTSDGVVFASGRAAQATIADSPEGMPLVYTAGGVWRVDEAGVWHLWRADAPKPGSGGALLGTNARVYTHDGATLSAWADRLLWQSNAVSFSGAAALQRIGQHLLLVAQDGTLAVWHEDGAVCANYRLYHRAAAPPQALLGADSTLRVVTSHAVSALSWARLTSDCR